SGYYSRIRRTKDWGDEETIRFYRCLHTIGTDFSMMLTMFQQRSRRDLKLKFKKEERINLNLVNKALLHPNEFNVDELRQQFAEEDEQIEKQREEEQQRKMEAVEQQQKEKLRKKYCFAHTIYYGNSFLRSFLNGRQIALLFSLLMRMSVSNSPQRRISKAERVMTDGSELEGEETKKPKRKATSKKRSIGKVDPGTISSNVTTAENQNEPQQPFETDPQGQTMAVEDISEIAPVTTEPKDDAPEDEASTKRKRAPVPRKRGAAKQAVATVISAIVEETEDQHPDAVPEDNVSVLTERLDNVAPVNTPSSNDPDEETFQKTKRTSEVKKRSNAKLDSSTEVLSIMEAKAQQQSEYVPEGTVLSASTDYTPMDTLQTDGKQEASVNAAPKKPPSPMPPSVPLSPSIVEEDIQQDSIDDGYSDDGGLQPGTSATTSVYAADTLVLPGHSNEQTSLPSTSTATSCYGPVNVTPKHELANLPQSSTLHTTEVGGSEFVANTVVKSPALEIPSEAKPCKDVPIDNDPSDVGDDVVPAEGEEEEDEDGDGGFSLEDIDINSLVLVESQDSGDPNKTFYEIYVSNPDTGQLSEKPLDVPADVIESIRQILEGGGER
uniref:Transcription factor TFIIIB component B'' Myb domain-containing protein n=1 Tax=Anopheles christyi TaxID=43041 RepID=A0A182KFQ9_9DIPT